MAIKPAKVKSVTEYGNALLLQKAMNDLKPLLIKGFPDNWMEIYSLSMLRVNGNVPLKRAESAWQKLYNVESITPNLKSQNLSKLMQDVGSNRKGQSVIFKKEDILIYFEITNQYLISSYINATSDIQIATPEQMPRDNSGVIDMFSR